MMRPRALLLFLFSFMLLAASSAAAAPRAIFLVRHAEKVDKSRDPDLSPAGHQRAQDLAKLLAPASVSVVFHTELKRTRDTASPLVKRLGLAPRIVPARDTPGLVKQLKVLGKEQVALVVGHSNTVPQILSGLGKIAPVKIADTEYGRLFLVVPQPTGEPTVVEMEF